MKKLLLKTSYNMEHGYSRSGPIPVQVVGLFFIMSIIFSSENLRSNMTDSMQCLGFSDHEQNEPPLYQLMGVPIFSADRKGDHSPNTTSESASQGFLNGLTWTKRSLQHQKSARIAMFPSWSWAGWASGIQKLLTIETGSSEEPRV